uniref:Uncharacterized protein n=1 Tax=Amphimedon queenslandica TaxID=400682 RepID=A0A1X7TDA2_AMPQE
MLNTCFSRSLEIRSRREIGWRSVGAEKGEDVLGIGITQEIFQGEGKEPVEMERLKICFNGSEIELAVDLSRREGIPLGPGYVQVGREEMSLETESTVHNRYSREGSKGAIVGEAGSTVKKLEKA